MGVRRLRFFTSAQREYLEQAFSAVVEAWYRKWFGPITPKPSAALLSDLDTTNERTIRVYRGEDGGWVALALERWAEFRMAAALFEIPFDVDFPMGPVARAVVDDSLRDLARVAMQSDVVSEFIHTEGPARLALPGDAFRNGTSSVGLSFDISGTKVSMFVGSAIVEQQLDRVERDAPARPLVDVTRALSERFVPLQVDLGSAEIRAEELLSLQVGDVVRIDKRIDEPLEVRVEGEGRLRGFLARTPDGHKCIRLVGTA